MLLLSEKAAHAFRLELQLLTRISGPPVNLKQ
jgi:hypothetical protein